MTEAPICDVHNKFDDVIPNLSEKYVKCIAFVCTIVYNKSSDHYIVLEGSFDMAKSANLYARIEPEIKEQAETILNALGIPASNAITMFYKQIILQRGLPFEVKLPEPPADISIMTAERLDAELEKGYADMQAGHTASLDQMPERFRVYDKEPWKSRNLRVMPVDNYLVFYIPNHGDSIVTVIRVMYGGRDVDRQLDQVK